MTGKEELLKNERMKTDRVRGSMLPLLLRRCLAVGKRYYRAVAGAGWKRVSARAGEKRKIEKRNKKRIERETAHSSSGRERRATITRHFGWSTGDSRYRRRRSAPEAPGETAAAAVPRAACRDDTAVTVRGHAGRRFRGKRDFPRSPYPAVGKL